MGSQNVAQISLYYVVFTVSYDTESKAEILQRSKLPLGRRLCFQPLTLQVTLHKVGFVMLSQI